jgi:hypothetical protein
MSLSLSWSLGPPVVEATHCRDAFLSALKQNKKKKKKNTKDLDEMKSERGVVCIYNDISVRVNWSCISF